MFNPKKFIIPLLMLVFALHGFAYYAFPDQHYLKGDGSGGWISYIKYVCLFFAILFLFQFRFEKYKLNWLMVGYGFMLLTLIPTVYWYSSGNILLAQFQFPILGYFFAGYAVKYFSSEIICGRILFALLVIIFFGVGAELVVGSFLDVYSRSGFRAVGPFVNPNNTGIVCALAAVVYHRINSGSKLNIAVTLMALFVILATGSKTALSVYVVGFLVIRSGYWRYLILMPVLGGLIFYSDAISMFWDFLELRQISIESGNIRLSTAAEAIENILTATPMGFLFGLSIVSMVDNAYLDMLNYGGVFLVTSFAVLQIISIYLSYKAKLSVVLLLHFLLIISMLTTNIPRLWPIAYLYWLLVGISILKYFQMIYYSRSIRWKAQEGSDFV